MLETLSCVKAQCKAPLNMGGFCLYPRHDCMITDGKYNYKYG